MLVWESKKDRENEIRAAKQIITLSNKIQRIWKYGSQQGDCVTKGEFDLEAVDAGGNRSLFEIRYRDYPIDKLLDWGVYLNTGKVHCSSNIARLFGASYFFFVCGNDGRFAVAKLYSPPAGGKESPEDFPWVKYDLQTVLPQRNISRGDDMNDSQTAYVIPREAFCSPVAINSRVRETKMLGDVNGIWEIAAIDG